MNWRGRYEGGGMVVTAKHWWSPRERKAARLAAQVLEYKAAELERETARRLTNLVLFGTQEPNLPQRPKFQWMEDDHP